MIFALLLMLCALTLFALANLFAAATFGAGLILLVALWLRRRGEFWWLLFGAALLGGGLGALGASYGAYFGAEQLWPDSLWPFASWIFGYIAGGIGGALVSSFFVGLRRRNELSLLKSALGKRFDSTKNRVKNLGFRQTLHLGAYTLRCAFFKRAGS